MLDNAHQAALRQTLVCPVCRSALRFQDDAAVCDIHGAFPVVNGVQSFRPGVASRFDKHWSAARNAPRAQSKRMAAKHFLAPILRSGGKGACKFLDVGCGDGVHIDVLAETEDPPQMMGLDVSLEALMMARDIKGNWLPIHGDAQALPFADGSFDFTISFGVLAYLEDPEKGLDELVRVTNSGGLIGLWFALKKPGVAGFMFEFARTIVPRLPRGLQRLVADAVVPFLGLMSTSSGLSLRTGSWSECREVILVNIAPPQLWLPRLEELEDALRERNCNIIREEWGPEGAVWARK
ncbi:MAG: class I SAM-dependent methyltransferase [Silicimonas sp.]|jgi:ubiquinone/menaquinone biosynthesis C-methylase UbiE|uniref:class I SAM-dependent methyltransferase n=1 Tax=Roseitalea porphyridii TaxID=1852022 RepID=UPI0032EF0350